MKQRFGSGPLPGTVSDAKQRDNQTVRNRSLVALQG